MSKALRHYDAVTTTATDDSICKSNRELAQFHYFNDNGLNHKHRAMSDTINQWVDDGHIPSGWILAYGSLNYYYTDKISKLAMQKRVKRIGLLTTLEGLQRQIDQGYTKLGEEILAANEVEVL